MFSQIYSKIKKTVRIALVRFWSTKEDLFLEDDLQVDDNSWFVDQQQTFHLPVSNRDSLFTKPQATLNEFGQFFELCTSCSIWCVLEQIRKHKASFATKTNLSILKAIAFCWCKCFDICIPSYFSHRPHNFLRKIFDFIDYSLVGY